VLFTSCGDAKANVGRLGGAGSAIFFEKNSKDERFSREDEAMLLMLPWRDIVWRERLRARISCAFLLCLGER